MSTRSISITGMLWCIAISLGYCIHTPVHVASTMPGPTVGSYEALHVSPGAANSYEVSMFSHDVIAEHLKVRHGGAAAAVLCYVILIL